MNQPWFNCVCVCVCVQVCLKPSGPQLFGGSEDEEDGDEEEDGARFDIRPQFEGRAGQKVREPAHTEWSRISLPHVGL